MANHVSHAALPYPIKNARFTLGVPYLDSTGAPTDPTTPDTEFSGDAGSFADCAEEVTTITGSNGQGYITLTGAETNYSLVALAAKVASGPKNTLAILYPRQLPIVSNGTLSAGSAGGGTLGTILGYDIVGCFIRTTGGTGGGGTGGANNQARKIATYTQATGVFTVVPNWETAPDATTIYDILLPDGAVFGALKALNPATAGRTAVVDASGLIDANGVKMGPTGSGTAQTARDLGASVLLSTGTGTGQLDFTSGVVKANLAQILGTALTETAGLLAGGFKKFFNIATPASTMDVIARVTLVDTSTTVTGGATAAALATVQADTDDIQTRLPAALTSGGNMKAGVQGFLDTVFTEGAAGRIAAAFKQFFNITSPAATMDHGILTDTTTALTNAPSDSSGITTLLSRLSAARATKLDASSVRDFTAQAGAAGSITLDAGASATDNLYKDLWVVIESGTGAGQTRYISGYTGSSKVATIAPNWITNPASDSVCALVPAGKIAGVVLTDTLTTYTGNTLQTGDAFARIGAAGAGLTALGDTRVANLDATISSRTKPADTQARVTLVDTLTTYTGNTPQTGDNYARIGAAGAGLTGVALSAAGIDAILDDPIGDGTLTMRQALRVIVAVTAGKISGAATTTITIRNAADSANVVVATVDASGNRTAVTVTP